MSNLIGTASDQVPINGMLGKAAFMDSDIPFSGAMSNTSTAPTIASAASISPVALVTFVSGVAAIAIIVPPQNIATTGGKLILIPTGIFTLATTGNIALASTAVVSKAMMLVYDATTAKWYPSY